MIDKRPPRDMRLAIDQVTRAILSKRDIDIGTILGSYEPINGTGPGYETNVPDLVMRDEFGAPDLTIHPDGTFLTTSAYATTDKVSLHGPAERQDGTMEDPLVMISGVNLAETAIAAAAGRRLCKVVAIDGDPDLAPLAQALVSRIVNGDTSANGGIAYCHIHLQPAWRAVVMPDYGWPGPSDI